MNYSRFFNSRLNTVIRLPVTSQGLYRVNIDGNTVDLPLKALEILNFKPCLELSSAPKTKRQQAIKPSERPIAYSYSKKRTRRVSRAA